jgi:hypothetical protein
VQPALLAAFPAILRSRLVNHAGRHIGSAERIIAAKTIRSVLSFAVSRAIHVAARGEPLPPENPPPSNLLVASADTAGGPPTGPIFFRSAGIMNRTPKGLPVRLEGLWIGRTVLQSATERSQNLWKEIKTEYAKCILPVPFVRRKPLE